jgi:hypothetical protein
VRRQGFVSLAQFVSACRVGEHRTRPPGCQQPDEARSISEKRGINNNT